MREMTWEEAESVHPGCSARFDRDIGDLMRGVTLYALEQFPVPTSGPSFRIWAHAPIENPEQIDVDLSGIGWKSHRTSIAYLSGAAPPGVTAWRYPATCTCGWRSEHYRNDQAEVACELHRQAVISTRRHHGMWAVYEGGSADIASSRFPRADLNLWRVLSEIALLGAGDRPRVNVRM